MKFDEDILLERLAEIAPVNPEPSRWLVAYSGGLDSTVLLHALASIAERTTSATVVALHVNHGLQPEADNWEAHCRDVAATLGVGFKSLTATVDTAADCGPEAAARQARYDVLRSCVVSGDCLLSAHHENDQAETLLLNLMRGSGVRGLAGIGTSQAFGAGHLLRPLLGVPVAALREYAQRKALRWVDDPSNEEQKFDRNFVRKQVIPLLAERWPAAAGGLRRSAELAAETGALLASLAELDLATAGAPERLSIDAIVALSEPRQRNLLRHAIHRCGLPTPPATRLQQVLHELLPARPDAQPLVRWPGAEVRRYREWLYLMPPLDDQSLPSDAALSIDKPLDLGPGLGCLRLEKSADFGIPEAIARKGLAIRFREGGERIRPLHGAHSQALRKLMQDAAIVPWMRHRIPLCYAGDELVAVADLWLAERFAEQAGFALCWERQPPLR